MKKKLLLGLSLLISVFIHAQQKECLNDFEYLVNKIQCDYPGYSTKVTSTTSIQLMQLKQKLETKIVRYPDSCWYYLTEYTNWFKDKHLRVIRKKVKKRTTTEDKPVPQFFKITYDSLNNSGKSIEGVWLGRGKFAIVKAPEDDFYYGVAIKYRRYKENQIMYKICIAENNEFTAVSYASDGSIKNKLKFSMHLNNKILEIHNRTRCVRVSTDEIADMALLQSYIPENHSGSNIWPVASSLGDSTYYLRIPSFHNNVALNLVKKNWDEISSRPNLIIDIRNNGGGQDQYYKVLAQLIYTKPYTSKGVEWYASKGNIKDFEDQLANGQIKNGAEGIKWTKSLLSEMRKSVGQFVVHPMMGKDKVIERDSIFSYPRKIGIIINENNASSAEQFLLEAKESEKAILFGNENTDGVLDYSNTTRAEFPSGHFRLKYPMTRSRRLPEYPIDNIGISPEINIPFPATQQLYDRLDSWVYFVKHYLELKN